MNTKTLTNIEGTDAVTLIVSLDDSGNPQVQASFWTTIDDLYCERIYPFQSIRDARSFVRDYSAVSAQDLFDEIAGV
jgi:hypothetical protein